MHTYYVYVPADQGTIPITNIPHERGCVKYAQNFGIKITMLHIRALTNPVQDVWKNGYKHPLKSKKREYPQIETQREELLIYQDAVKFNRL